MVAWSCCCARPFGQWMSTDTKGAPDAGPLCVGAPAVRWRPPWFMDMYNVVRGTSGKKNVIGERDSRDDRRYRRAGSGAFIVGGGGFGGRTKGRDQGFSAYSLGHGAPARSDAGPIERGRRARLAMDGGAGPGALHGAGVGRGLRREPGAGDRASSRRPRRRRGPRQAISEWDRRFDEGTGASTGDA